MAVPHDPAVVNLRVGVVASVVGEFVNGGAVPVKNFVVPAVGGMPNDMTVADAAELIVVRVVGNLQFFRPGQRVTAKKQHDTQSDAVGSSHFVPLDCVLRPIENKKAKNNP
jgi:hypothetical protein